MKFDRILLWPYYLTLKIRNNKYKNPSKKQHAEIPVICVGNVTVGGTGKTPHTEMLLRLLKEDAYWTGKNIAVLSRGYKRTSKGFQQVTVDGTASFYGDEPLQVKRKFLDVTVALDKDRIRGCKYLAHPDFVKVLKTNRKCKAKQFPKADLVLLDDGFQYQKLYADLNIVLVDYSRPVYEDSLLPLGHLRDIPERLSEADIVIVTKCPSYLSEEERDVWKARLRIADNQKIFFTTISYCQAEPVFGECDTRYRYSGQTVLFTGIANDLPLRRCLCDEHKIMDHIRFRDHHKFTRKDLQMINAVAEKYPRASVFTTEKDATRIVGSKIVPALLKQKLFYVPIEVSFLTEEEQAQFMDAVLEAIKP